jgi:hypothetical protein
MMSTRRHRKEKTDGVQFGLTEMLTVRIALFSATSLFVVRREKLYCVETQYCDSENGRLFTQLYLCPVLQQYCGSGGGRFLIRPDNFRSPVPLPWAEVTMLFETFLVGSIFSLRSKLHGRKHWIS